VLLPAVLWVQRQVFDTKAVPAPWATACITAAATSVDIAVAGLAKVVQIGLWYNSITDVVVISSRSWRLQLRTRAVSSSNSSSSSMWLHILIITAAAAAGSSSSS
jgi:hypothetical protein